MAAINGIIGDDNPAPTQPANPIVEEGSLELKKAAAFVKTPEFKELKQHLESRIDFYQKYLPNGENVIAKSDTAELGYMWLAANVIIGECRAIINGYEQAAELLKTNQQ